MKKIKSILIILVSIILTAFILLSTGIISIPNSQDFFLLENPDEQAQLKSKLEKLGIPISIDKKGAIIYDSKYSQFVQKVAKEIMSSSYPTSTIISYVEPKYNELLIEKLKTNNVPFDIEYVKHEKHISLSYKEKQKWIPIKQEIDNMFIKDHNHLIK